MEACLTAQACATLPGGTHRLACNILLPRLSLCWQGPLLLRRPVKCGCLGNMGCSLLFGNGCLPNGGQGL